MPQILHMILNISFTLYIFYVLRKYIPLWGWFLRVYSYIGSVYTSILIRIEGKPVRVSKFEALAKRKDK